MNILCRCPVCGKFLSGFKDYVFKDHIKVVCIHHERPGDTHFIYMGPMDLAKKMGIVIK